MHFIKSKEIRTMTNLTLESKERIHSIDFLRGLVMILMAIDHVRVYSGIPPGGPEIAIFFTRWVTHFCAPVFVFLSGTSVYLYQLQKDRNKQNIRNFLITRGVVLIFLELTLIRFFWTFNLDFSKFILAGVIWMIGWCMVLLALLINFKPWVVGIIGLAIIFGQQAFALVPKILPPSLRESFGVFWEFIYSSGLQGPSAVTILYVLVPWIGVMAVGYWFGELFLMPFGERKKWLIGIGSTATFAFLIVGTIDIILKTTENATPFIIKLLNQTKYPASQLFLLMTLGPFIWLMPFVEKANSRIHQTVSIFGAVPFFYYILHILLIHLTSIGVMWLLHGETYIEGYETAPYTEISEGYRWSLPTLYLVFIINIVVLYFLCRWYKGYKKRHSENMLLKYF